jgi:hypothetical protein
MRERSTYPKAEAESGRKPSGTKKGSPSTRRSARGSLCPPSTRAPAARRAPAPGQDPPTRTARSTLTRPPRHSRAAACPAAARRRRRRPRGPGGCPILNRVDRRVIKQILGANYWLIGDRSRNAGGQARVVTSDTAQVSASAARRVGGTTASWVAQGIVR